MKGTRYLLGIVGSRALNVETNIVECSTKMEISEDILQWLEGHDKRIGDKGETIFICNEVEYEFLGIAPKPQTILTGEPGEA